MVVKAVIMFGREMQPHAFLLLLWLKKKSPSEFPFSKIYFFSFIYLFIFSLIRRRHKAVMGSSKNGIRELC